MKISLSSCGVSCSIFRFGTLVSISAAVSCQRTLTLWILLWIVTHHIFGCLASLASHAQWDQFIPGIWDALCKRHWACLRSPCPVHLEHIATVAHTQVGTLSPLHLSDTRVTTDVMQNSSAHKQKTWGSWTQCTWADLLTWMVGLLDLLDFYHPLNTFWQIFIFIPFPSCFLWSNSWDNSLSLIILPFKPFHQ